MIGRAAGCSDIALSDAGFPPAESSRILGGGVAPPSPLRSRPAPAIGLAPPAPFGLCALRVVFALLVTLAAATPTGPPGVVSSEVAERTFAGLPVPAGFTPDSALAKRPVRPTPPAFPAATPAAFTTAARLGDGRIPADFVPERAGRADGVGPDTGTVTAPAVLPASAAAVFLA